MGLIAALCIAVGIAGCERAAQAPEKMPAADNSGDVRELLSLINEKDSASAAVVQSSAALNQVYDRLLFLASRRTASPAVIKETARMTATLDSLTRIVRTGKEHLKSIDARLAAMQGKNSMVMDALPAVRQNIAGMTSGLDMQEAGVSGLRGDVGDFKKRTERRMAEIARIRAEQLKKGQTGAAPANTDLYYVVGTERELLNRKIVQEAGGADLWIFGKLGVTLQPSKELPQTEFQKFNPKQGNELNLDSVIARPGKGNNKPKHFKVISAHSDKFIEPLTDSTRTIRKFRINDDEKFWKPSPYLIIVVDEDE